MCGAASMRGAMTSAGKSLGCLLGPVDQVVGGAAYPRCRKACPTGKRLETGAPTVRRWRAVPSKSQARALIEGWQMTANTGRLSVAPSIGLRTSFAVSNLPLVCELARVCKEAIIPVLPAQTRAWPFEDRVLAYLLPSLHDDIIRFHAGDGPDLLGLLNSGGRAAISHLDQEAVGLLMTLVRREAPDLHAQLVRG